ncbi:MULTISPECIES: hypothetical protein [unclassified Vibrio]|uniref:hypothetical protein n=1 Tax=unclassified Vibrio TaxID=2614977 RepID=UPI001361B6D0|nr:MULTISPECIES: hypothetical protein [unclassified Vibrio]NAW58728.1 hypothetical protein [Vibrio sp. V36_P2S2PM302]NAX21215.1 hypothetical protein [Vibrio sp. V39_P1S14PM300]NAX25110.1 hypothetical protein [Vibrio sp. V38_P2S17PM301]NAX32818.1 hypothetical protein [Vibrio sp. V37_P2S8PM304]
MDRTQMSDKERKLHFHNQNRLYIINNKEKRRFRIKLRDSLINTLTWLCWSFLLLHPLLHEWLYPDREGGLLFGMNLSDILLSVAIMLLGIILLFHFWSKLKRLLWSLESRFKKHD